MHVIGNEIIVKNDNETLSFGVSERLIITPKLTFETPEKESKTKQDEIDELKKQLEALKNYNEVLKSHNERLLENIEDHEEYEAVA